MEYVTLSCGVLVSACTDAAVLLKTDGEDCWIPRSLIEEGQHIYRGMDSGNISVAKWFAVKNGLEF